MLLSKYKHPYKARTTENSTFKIWKFAIEFQARYQFQKDKRQVGIWMRDELVSLGPAFVKIGQFLSTRIDVFGKDITDRLGELQDQISPYPFEAIEPVLNEEYNGNYKDIFSYVDPIPIASASIGQVHKAVLKKSNQTIVLKIQKPDIETEIKNDLMTLMSINQIFTKFGFQQAKDFDAILTQYKQFLANEVNYQKEARFMMYFRRKLIDKQVYIPKPLAQSTSRVLVMEYVESIKINDLASFNQLPFDKTELAKRLVQLFLYQIIDIGSVHCDPHPGNIGVRKNGDIVLYDFGNVVQLTDNFRSKINNLVFSIYQKDTDEFLDLLLELKIIEPKDNFDVLELKAFFNYFFDYLETLDFDQLRGAIQNKDLFIDTDIQVNVDPDFLSLFRVFSLIDGTCSLLDPQFNYILALAPYSENLFMNADFLNYRVRKDIEKLSSYPRMLKNTDQNILRVSQRFTKINTQFNQFRIFTVLILLLENMDDPIKISAMLPLFVVLFWSQK